MSNLLVIESSPNLVSSATRKLSTELVDAYVATHPDTKVTARDLVKNPVPHLGVDLLGGFFAPPESHSPAQTAALKVSEEIIAEVQAADTIVLAAPLHNFNIPSVLKAWLDHLVRAGKTFHYTAEGPKGLVHGKKLYLVLAKGGVYSDGPFKAYDFQEPYLRAILGFIGITDVTVVVAEGLALGPDAATASIAKASDAIAHLFN